MSFFWFSLFLIFGFYLSNPFGDNNSYCWDMGMTGTDPQIKFVSPSSPNNIHCKTKAFSWVLVTEIFFFFSDGSCNVASVVYPADEGIPDIINPFIFLTNSILSSIQSMISNVGPMILFSTRLFSAPASCRSLASFVRGENSLHIEGAASAG